MGSQQVGGQVQNIRVSKVIVPAVTLTKPPSLDNIDLIKIAAAKLEFNERSKKLDVAAVDQELDAKWKKLDENIKKKFGPIEKQDKTKIHWTYLMKPLRLDEKKLFARSIALSKDPRDTVSKNIIAKIYRNDAKNQAKKPAITEAVLPTETSKNLDEGKKEEPKQIKRKFRYKIHAKRKINFDKDKEDYMPAQSIITSQSVIPTVKEAEFKVDPNITFHSDPVVLKVEPIDWDSLPLPDLNLPIFAKQKKTKERVVKTVKPTKLKSTQVAKPKPTINK
ncbi:hypothetical protein AgCh_002124 [Apium graveolens]